MPIDVAGNLGSGIAHTVTRPLVHERILDDAPQALYEYIVSPSTAPIHTDLVRRAQHHIVRLRGGELVVLVGIDNLGATFHGNIGGVQCPNLVGLCDSSVAQQIRVDIVARCGLAGACLGCQGADAHALTQGAHMDSTHLDVQSLKLAYQHAWAHVGVLQVQLVDLAHEGQISLAVWPGQVVDAAPVDAQIGRAHI